jgi:predicted nucleotidyltransferase/HEPN domain-containing protein
MKTDLDHLPSRKQRDIQRIVEIIFAEFEEATKLATQKWKKQGRILKIILYGSHARGDWVSDPVGGYFSDYDILVVVNDERLLELGEIWTHVDDRLVREHAVAKRLSAEVGLIAHTMQDVNFQLSRGRPFFIDIVRDGIALYDLDDRAFDKPQPLSPEVAREEATTHFDQWFKSASEALASAKDMITHGRNNWAAFMLHQAAEHAYLTTLLVLTLYSPKSHNIKFLRNKAEDIARDLIPVWPRDSKFGRRCWELLRQAYVKARYSPHYKITGPELEWLVERIELLHAEVKAIAEQRLAEG